MKRILILGTPGMTASLALALMAMNAGIETPRTAPPQEPARPSSPRFAIPPSVVRYDTSRRDREPWKKDKRRTFAEPARTHTRIHRRRTR